MSESIEKMVSQLITMVGKVLEGQAEAKTEMAEMKAEMSEIKTEIVLVKNRLDDIDDKLTYLTSDVELIEQKNLQNEKEINRIKKQIQA